MPYAALCRSWPNLSRIVEIVGGVSISLVILGVLFFMGRGLPLTTHIGVMQELFSMEKSNAVMNEEWIRTRNQDDANYDHLTEAAANLLHSQQRLGVLLPRAFGEPLMSSYQQLNQSIQHKQKLFEKFKDLNSKFHHTLNLFPQAYLVAMAAVRQNGEESLLENLQDLPWLILLGNTNKLHGTPLTDQELLAKLEGQLATLSPDVRSTLAAVLTHGQKIVHLRAAVDAVLAEANAVAVTADIHRLFATYNELYQTADMRAAFFRNLMFFTTTFLVLTLLWFVVRMRRSALMLQETVCNLEFQKFALDQHAIVSISNVSGKIIYANKKFCDISGYALEELLGRNHNIVNSGNHSQAFFAEMWRTISAGGVWYGDIMNRSKSGGTYWVNSTIVPFLDAAGKPFQYVSIRNDITKRKTLEYELIDARDEANASARIKADFLANMSHEIRTPMNAIIGFAEVALQDRELSAQTKKHMDIIFNSARSLLRIINDILDVSKLESGKLTLETVCFHLPNALADALQTVQHRVVEQDLELKVDYDINLPCRFMGDPTRLRQVILNLVGNAIKFTQKGVIFVAVHPGDAPEMLHFIVTDTGIGMTPEQAAKVFDAFSQADASTTRRFGGTGLGTTISKQIVELMGGKIWVESQIDQGSAFHFTAHLAPATTDEGCLFAEGGTDLEEYVSPRLFHILLAEDIEANATLAILRLQQQGHTIYWAHNGQEAVTASQADRYDLILMDVMMPEMDGLQATKEIRLLEKKTGMHIPVLALTAGAMPEDHAKCYAAGMDGVAAKPIHFSQLFASIEAIVPAGVGMPNISRKIVFQTQPKLDFSPVDGIVDHENALKTWQNPEIYTKALRAFAVERVDDAVKIERLLATHPDEAKMLTHALKGVAGNLAIVKVAHLAAEIDTKLSCAQPMIDQAKLDKLRLSLQEVVVAIGKLRLPSDGSITLTQIFDATVVQELLAKLLLTFDELNPDAVEPVLVKLAEFVTPCDWAPIQKEVDAFNFDMAKVKTNALMDKLGLGIS